MPGNIIVTHAGVNFGKPKGPTYLVGYARSSGLEYIEAALHAGYMFNMLCAAVGVDDDGMFGAVFIVSDHENSTFMECKRRFVEEVPNKGVSELGPVYVTALPPFDTQNNIERAARVHIELGQMVERFQRTDAQLR